MIRLFQRLAKSLSQVRFPSFDLSKESKNELYLECLVSVPFWRCSRRPKISVRVIPPLYYFHVLSGLAALAATKSEKMKPQHSLGDIPGGLQKNKALGTCK